MFVVPSFYAQALELSKVATSTVSVCLTHAPICAVPGQAALLGTALQRTASRQALHVVPYQIFDMDFGCDGHSIGHLGVPVSKQSLLHIVMASAVQLSKSQTFGTSYPLPNRVNVARKAVPSLTMAAHTANNPGIEAGPFPKPTTHDTIALTTICRRLCSLWRCIKRLLAVGAAPMLLSRCWYS